MFDVIDDVVDELYYEIMVGPEAYELVPDVSVVLNRLAVSNFFFNFHVQVSMIRLFIESWCWVALSVGCLIASDIECCVCVRVGVATSVYALGFLLGV